MAVEGRRLNRMSRATSASLQWQKSLCSRAQLQTVSNNTHKTQGTDTYCAIALTLLLS